MHQRTAVLACLALTVAACSVTVVPPPQAPAPQPAPAVVQTPPPAPPPQPVAPPPQVVVMPDPPTRVGRLGLVLGTVSYRPEGTEEWAPAEPNWPIASGDRVWTDVDSRAEVDVGAVIMRVGPQSELDVVQLDDRTVQVRLPQGALTERVMDQDGEAHEIDAPNAAVSVDRPGVYRVDVSPDGMTTTVTVWGGEATVSEAGSSFVVNARQSATVLGPGDSPTFRLADAAPPDAFDRWGMERDAERDRLAAGPQYVPVGIPGASDLGAYGRWEVDPALGPVWYPTTVAAGWAPYRTGHWAFVRPWGWTWVDTAPWGYAPYHYGRWAYRNNAWGWCPGRATNAPPAYAPALVQFVNAPAPNGATVAWTPLGPGDAYQPAYSASPAYRARFAIAGPGAAYRNQNAPSAVTVVQQQTFASQQHVENHLVVNATRATGIIAGGPAVQPVRIVPASRAVPPQAITTRAVVAIHEPPAARHDVVVIHPGVRAAAPARTETAPVVVPAAQKPAVVQTASKPAVVEATPKPAVEPAPTPARLTPMQNNTRAWKAGQVSPALEADYEKKKQELEARHKSEIEHPREGEAVAERDARHEQEKKALDAAYEKAKASGATSIPNGAQ